ncbi:MAG: DUF5916 domain-containing protein [Gemmatimonadota bacterium]
MGRPLGWLVAGIMAGALAAPSAGIASATRLSAQTGASAEPGATRVLEASRPDVPVHLPRLRGPVTLDGSPTEAAWQDVPALPLTMYFPTFRGAPQERSEIRVAYDDDYLYAAGWFYDSDPDGIRIHSLYRDRWNGDDAFALYVDAFNDNQNAKWFGVTPAATRFDLLVSEDGAALNDSWDAFWDAATQVAGNGWFVEVRIPFSTIGFQVDTAGRATMGLTVTRLVSRTGERVTFPAIDPQFAFRQPSVAQDVVVEGVHTDRPLYLSSYVLGGVDRAATRAAAGTPWTAETGTTREVGVDLKYALSSNLTLDVTANTDFAQVEADDQQVSLDRFSLFFPEKRRFFQEGSGVFDFATGAGSRLFHSRRIGLTDTNEPVPVLGGARLVGRVGEWEVGALAMQTSAVEALPTETFGAARLLRRVLNDYSTMGGMITTRARSGHVNVATGLDGAFRLFGDTYLGLKWAGTFGDGEGGDLFGRSHLNARWQRRANRGLAYTIEYTRSGERYQPELGFLPRRDFTQANLLGNYFIFTDAHPFFRRVYPGLLAFSTFRNQDGTLESGTYAVWVQWETKGGGGGWIEPKLFVEDVRAPFSIGGAVEIPEGRYTYADLQFVWTMNQGRKLRTDIDARAGSFFDGTRTQVIAGPTWNASPRFEVGADYQWTRLRFDERAQATDIHLARVRLRTALDSKASGNAFVQYNSTTDRLDLNVRLRYNFAEGHDLWLVFNDGLATERLPDPGEPRLPLSLRRTFIIKYTHTWGG